MIDAQVVYRVPDGKPQLPLNVGIMTVRNLGKVCLEKHFHTERYIFPVGYEVTRYASFLPFAVLILPWR